MENHVLWMKMKNQREMKNSLPKFLVYFRRPDDYRGEFGFDWIRDEYIYPIVKKEL